MKVPSPLALLLPALALLSACGAPAGGYPSLLPRANEQRDDAEPVRASPVAAADPALDAMIAAARARLDKAAADYASLAPRAESLAEQAKGLGIGSDVWLDAQAAIANLDSVRSESAAVVADLDRTSIERAAGGAPAYPALDSLRMAAAAQLREQSAVIARVEALLPAA